MIAALLADAEAVRMVAPLVIAALMVHAFWALTAAVVRTSRGDRARHAAFWSPPRPAQLLAVGRHTEAYRRRQYAATRAKHTTRTA